MATSDVTLFICTSCTADRTQAARPGQALYDAVSAAVAAKPDCDLTVKPVDCLAVCKRPCTIAMSNGEKWTYVIGDLTAEANVEDVIAAAVSYGASANGIIPWRERPISFRKGVISRVPPLGFKPEDQGL